MSEWQSTLTGDYYRYENGTAIPLTLAYVNNLEAECARLRAAIVDAADLAGAGFSDAAEERLRSALEPTAEKEQPSDSLKVSDTTND